jgi:hypothetical protein
MVRRWAFAVIKIRRFVKKKGVHRVGHPCIPIIPHFFFINQYAEYAIL